jgi:UDP-glucose 4-epimerase
LQYPAGVRVIVTGGAGFIGSHIVDALVAAGDDVEVIDDLSRGHRRNVPSGVALHVVDVRDADAVQAVFAAFGPDVVCHQAAQTSVPASFRDPAFDADVNVRGGLHVLDAARRHGAQRFVHASSGGAIYGEIAEDAVGSRRDPPAPATPYGWSKLAFDGIATTLAAAGGPRVHALRYANVYGPRQDAAGEAGVVAVFTAAARAGEPLHVFGRATAGDGGGVRDYVWVHDVVAASLAALHGRVDEACIDVGTGVGTTSRALAEAVAAAAGRQIEIVDDPPRPGGVARSVVDGTDLRALVPRPTALARGLAQMLTGA